MAEALPSAQPATELRRESAELLGLGRSTSFPFTEWRDNDVYRTVFFDEGEGPALVFVHGLGGNATHFELVAVPLARRYRVVGLDLVGCGCTLKPDCAYSVDLLRDHLFDFLDRRGISRATLIGHSLGGAVCVAAALQRPTQFDGLALICAAGLAPLPAGLRVAATLMLRERLLYAFMRYGSEFILRNVFVDQRSEGVRWFRRSALRDAPGFPHLHDFARISTTLAADVAARDYSRQLGQLHLPVLALWGDADKLTARAKVLRSLGRLRRVRTVMLRDCGHLAMIEHPEEVLFHLERFLEKPP